MSDMGDNDTLIPETGGGEVEPQAEGAVAGPLPAPQVEGGRLEVLPPIVSESTAGNQVPGEQSKLEHPNERRGRNGARVQFDETRGPWDTGTKREHTKKKKHF